MKTRKQVLLFFTASALMNLAASFAHPVTPTIFTGLGLGSYMFGYALAAMMTMQFLMSPFWGNLNSYIGSRNVLMISCIGYGVGQIFFGLSQTEFQFIIARAFTGIFVGGSFTAVLTYITNTSPEKTRGRYLAVQAAANMVCSAFGYMIGGLLGEIHTYLAIVVQVICLCLSGVMFRFFCEDDTVINRRELKLKRLVKEANPLAAILSGKKFMTITLAVLFFVCMLQNLGYTEFDQTFNYYLRDQFGFSSGYNGIVKGIMGLIALLANTFIAIRLINRTDVKKSVIPVLALTAVFMLATVLVDDIVPFIVFDVLFFAFNSVSLPMLQSIVADAGKGQHSNLVMGFYNSVKSLGGIIGAVAAGSLYTLSPKNPFIMGFIALALSAIGSTVYLARVKKAK